MNIWILLSGKKLHRGSRRFHREEKINDEVKKEGALISVDLCAFSV